jgi:Restriction endonuclease
MTELSSPGVDEQPFLSSGQGVRPERVLVAPKVALLRYDSPPWMSDQKSSKQRRQRAHTHSPFRGVSTQEILDALADAFSPAELDWELVGVAFVQARPDPRIPAPSPVEVMVDSPPWASEVQSAPADRPAPARTARDFTARRPPRWLREHDEIVAAVRGLSWEGYFSLVADIFRCEGYEVFGGEGPDGDVIDMEVMRGAERMLVSCQLRGLDQIGVEPLNEMVLVAQRSDAGGVFIISDGDFSPDAWSFAAGQGITLIDREILTGLVLDLTLGAGRRTNLRAQVRRLLAVLRPGPGTWDLANRTQ